MLALRSAGVSPGEKTVAWLVAAQNADGGFAVAPESSSDSDMTGATLQALAVVGRKRAAATRRAVAWLRANQNDDGGFGQFRGRPSNAQSTAYAVQGLVAAGAGGATLTRALAYLRGLQRADGSVSYSSTSNQTPVWVTAQALMALERKTLPSRPWRGESARSRSRPWRRRRAEGEEQNPAQTADPSRRRDPGPDRLGAEGAGGALPRTRPDERRLEGHRRSWLGRPRGGRCRSGRARGARRGLFPPRFAVAGPQAS